MKRAVASSWIVLLLVVAAGAYFVQNSGSKPKPWIPPKTSLPKEFVDSTAFLLKHGFGDPRGLVFGSATVAIEGQNMGSMCGWLDRNSNPHRILTASGVAYPIEGEGTILDLENTVKQACNQKTVYFDGGSLHYSAPSKPSEMYRAEILSSTFAAQLLIAGQTSLADDVYKNRLPRYFGWVISTESEIGISKTMMMPAPTTRMLVDEFVSSLCLQAVSAHRYGDDRLARDVSKLLSDNLAAIEDFADRFDKTTFRTSSGKQSHFGELAFIDEILRDSERRLTEGRKTLDLQALDSLSSEDRISKLIDLMDQITGSNKQLSSSSSFVNDPIYKRLVAEGEKAGDALLDCMEKDVRLTRDMNLSPLNLGVWHMVSVKEAAQRAFIDISEVDAFTRNVGGKVKVSDLHRFWQRAKNLPLAERWLSVLEDDQCSHIEWASSAAWLAGIPFGRYGGKGSWTLESHYQELSPDKRQRLLQLLSKRANKIEQANTDPSTMRLYDHGNALTIALAAYELDRKESLPLLRSVASRMFGDNLFGKYFEPTGSSLNAVASILLKASDGEFEKSYINWLKSLPASTMSEPRLFSTLLSLPEGQSSRIVKTVLAAEDSNLNLRKIVQEGGPYPIDKIMFGDLASSPGFRQCLIKALSDQEEVAQVRLGSNYYEFVGMSKGWCMNRMHLEEANRPMAVKAKGRICDFYAFQVSRVRGSPEFSMIWPDAKKDRAIKGMVDLLKRSGKLYPKRL